VSNSVLTIMMTIRASNSQAPITTVSEAGCFDITVCLRAIQHSASVNFATSDGTAHATAKSVATSGTLNYSDGQTSQTFHGAGIDNNISKEMRRWCSTFQSFNLATLLNPNAATLTILDNDAA